MTIAFDASLATIEKKTGTEYYTAQLLITLAKLDHKNQYILYSDRSPKGELSKLPKNYSWKIIPFPHRLWHQTHLTWEALLHPANVFFEPAHTTPLFMPRRTKLITVIHDLSFVHFPYLYRPIASQYHYFCLKRALKITDKIITPSQYTKNDLINYYHIQQNKITIIPHGYGQELYYPKQAKILDKQSRPYIFYIGRIEEKKNILGMLEAYELLRREQKITHRFLLAGRPGYGYEKIKKKISSLPSSIRSDVVELGYVAESELTELMRNADIFLFTTFFEGFGIPIIEAMASRVPVITSNITSMPEVAGKAALCVDPHNPSEISAALSKIINDRQLRQKLVSKGLTRAAFFSWNNAAKKTLEIIKEIGNV